MVEKQDTESCSVLGGQQMILTGQNFSSDSKVVFTEKTHDGQQIWEVEATVDKDKSQPSMLFVEIPAYRDPSICHSAKVNFYVINGKRKRSQSQHFTYTPMPVPSIKTEPLDEYEAHGHMGYATPHMLGLSPQTYYHPQPPHLHHGLVPCQQPDRLGLHPPRQDPRFQQQSPAIVFSRGAKTPGSSPGGLYQPPHGVMVPDQHCSVLVHTGSPAQAAGPLGNPQLGPHPSIIHFSPTNQHLLRVGDPPPLQADGQNVIYCDGYSPQGADADSPSPGQPQHFPTVIQQQQQVFGPKEPLKGRPPVGTAGLLEPSGDGPRRVTVKEENLDQAYLDDVNEIIRKDLTAVQARGQT